MDHSAQLTSTVKGNNYATNCTPNQAAGETYVLPHKVYANVDSSSQDSFRAAGLALTVLEPFRRWRILFNGMMK